MSTLNLERITDVIINQLTGQSPNKRKRSVSTIPTWVVLTLCVPSNMTLTRIRWDYHNIGRFRAFIGVGHRPADVNLVPAVLTHIRLIETLFNPGTSLLVIVVLLLTHTFWPRQIGLFQAEQIPAPLEHLYELWIRALILPLVKLTAYRECLTDCLAKHDERGQVIGGYKLQRILINSHFDMRPLSGSTVLEIKTYLPAFTIRKQEAVSQSPQLLVRVFDENTQLPERLLLSLLLCNFMMADWKVSSSQNCHNRTNGLHPIGRPVNNAEPLQDNEQRPNNGAQAKPYPYRGQPECGHPGFPVLLHKPHALATEMPRRMPAPCHHVQQVAV